MTGKQRCGAKYVARRVNGVTFYSYCGRKAGHWGRHR